MIPLRDDIPSLTRPFVNYLLILACVVVFLYMLSLGSRARIEAFAMAHGAIPTEIVRRREVIAGYAAIVTSLFMHGGWVHLLGNMLYLWVFGDNVEDLMGHSGYLLFYIVVGVIATITHILVNPTSAVPVIGASGAIAGVLGAYLVLFPRAEIVSLVDVWTVRVPAVIFLPIWFLMQFLSGLASIGGEVPVAWAAHISGFLAGVGLVLHRAQDLR